uniref:Thyroglobulin type-1 domain-containing protein n=1 Tax=Lates calcarifer TaxID=8187 RepID=A0A4W6FXW3_LATCA
MDTGGHQNCHILISSRLLTLKFCLFYHCLFSSHFSFTPPCTTHNQAEILFNRSLTVIFSCPELTAPPIWMTILMNSVRRPTESPQTCERERASLLSQKHLAWQEERFIPVCTTDGRYNPVQCHRATGYCWCVRVDSGRPLSGTSARNHVPDCSGAEGDPERTYISYREKSLPGCPGAHKEKFLQSLVRVLQLERAGSLSPYQITNAPPSSSPSPFSNSPTSATPSSSSSPSSPLNVAPSTALEVVESSRPEAVLQWHFSQLDVDSNGVLSEREARPLRQFLRRRLKPRRCAKKFAQYCDRDGDRGLTLVELRVCLGL